MIANKLAYRLRAEGWSVFLDVQTRVGRYWNKEIEREMHAARALVVLWSAQSRESNFVVEEMCIRDRCCSMGNLSERADARSTGAFGAAWQNSCIRADAVGKYRVRSVLAAGGHAAANQR